jgi:excisionase family DNA binding protein
MKKEIPFWEKSNLTLEEASAYFNIGMNKLCALTADEKCPYVLWIGRKRLIKKACFEEYLRKTYSL